MNQSIVDYVKPRVAEFDRMSVERRAQLAELTHCIQRQRSAGQPVKLTFICTHNSRRSHMAQLWAAVAAVHYGIEDVETYSGGTEETAFNPRAVAALQRAGFAITLHSPDAESGNPRYEVRFAAHLEPLLCFSKAYDAHPNPASDFCAVMVCSQADDACPTVRGAAHRVSIPYEDPKLADGTSQEMEIYDERCAQIAREMLFVFSHVR